MKFVEESKFKKEIGIYKIVNLVNGKVYIGQTGQNFQRRYWHHQWKLRNNSHDNKYLQNAWNKYGEDNFSFEVVEITTKDSLDEKEKFWIEYYRNTVGCYSIQDGGQPHDLVRYVTPEMRKLVGEKNRQHLLGTKASEETRKKMSESQKGKHLHRKTDKLNDELAFQIKTKLIQGCSPKEIMNELNIPYHYINGILSCNTWKHVIVEGWEDFQKNRPRGKGKSSVGRKINSITIEEAQQVYNLYKSLGSERKTADALGRSVVYVHRRIQKIKQLSS